MKIDKKSVPLFHFLWGIFHLLLTWMSENDNMAGSFLESVKGQQTKSQVGLYVLTSLSALCWLGGAFSVKGPRRHVFRSLSLSGLSQTYQLSVFKYNEMDFKSNRMRWFHKSKKRSRAKHDRAVSHAGSGDALTAGIFTYLHMHDSKSGSWHVGRDNKCYVQMQ